MNVQQQANRATLGAAASQRIRPRSTRRARRKNINRKEPSAAKAATKRIGISPAKTQRAQRKRNDIYPNLAFFAPWREEYPNPRFSCIGKFAQAAKIFKHSSAKDTKDVGVGFKPALVRGLRDLLRKYAGWRAWVSFSTTPRFRHSSMECWNPGRHGCLRTHPAHLDAGHPCRHDEALHFHALGASVSS
jgi:hypothetical protein